MIQHGGSHSNRCSAHYLQLGHGLVKLTIHRALAAASLLAFAMWPSTRRVRGREGGREGGKEGGLREGRRGRRGKEREQGRGVHVGEIEKTITSISYLPDLTQVKPS